MTFFQCGFKAPYAFPRTDLATGERTFEKQTLIIAGITTLGDASVCMWLFFEYLHGAYGYTLATIFAWCVARGTRGRFMRWRLDDDCPVPREPLV